ncbi:DegT/DnrJ/EryC1/StrS family aminotransferase [Candidatus Woesearchaeota archaeon]|nr:DegT/DnrJ/EryC1/StrS family aminotransferase [Candidatus Woesearchaeota archaeon]
MKVPLCKPYFDEKENEAVKEVLDSGWLAHGPKTKEFEKLFADYIGVKHAIAVNSCTSGLQLALHASDLRGEVIIPSFTFVATANAVINAGCKPIFADIKYDTCNIDPDDVENKITKDTVAIMPVHYAGQSVDMDRIMDLANKHNLVVIEDSAETIGGTFNDKKTGGFGIGVFSFYPTKNITTAEGGMITTNDSELAHKIEALKAHGVSSSAFERERKEKPWLRDAIYSGYNYRLPDVLAALGIVQLKKLEEMNRLRRAHACYLNENLSKEFMDLPVEDARAKHVYQMYTIKLHDNIDRTKFLKFLRDKEIGASVHFDPPVHKQSFYKNHNASLPVTEKVSEKIVTLPMFPGLKKEELDYIIKVINEAIKFSLI